MGNLLAFQLSWKKRQDNPELLLSSIRFVEDGEFEQEIEEVTVEGFTEIKFLINAVVFDLVSGIVVAADFVSPHSQPDFGPVGTLGGNTLVFFHLPKSSPK